MLWTDERIRSEYVNASYGERSEASALLFAMRDEYEARIAELEAQLLDAECVAGDALNQLDNAEATAARIAELEAHLAEIKDDHAARFEQMRAGYVTCQQHVTELKAALNAAKERAVYSL